MAVIPNPDPQIWRMILEHFPEGPEDPETGEKRNHPEIRKTKENQSDAEIEV